MNHTDGWTDIRINNCTHPVQRKYNKKLSY